MKLFDIKSDSIIPNCDSTLFKVHGIDSTYMKRAALYARVSGDLQAKEGTIESQVLALKKQIRRGRHREDNPARTPAMILTNAR